MPSKDPLGNYIEDSYWASQGVYNGNSTNGWLNAQQQQREQEEASRRAAEARARAQEQKRQQEARRRQAEAEAKAAKEAAAREKQRAIAEAKAHKECERLERDAREAARVAQQKIDAARAAGSKLQADLSFKPTSVRTAPVAPATSVSHIDVSDVTWKTPPEKKGLTVEQFFGLIAAIAATVYVARRGARPEWYWWPIGFTAVWIAATLFFNKFQGLTKLLCWLLIAALVFGGIGYLYVQFRAGS